MDTGFQGAPVIDADGHVIEANDMTEKYLDPAFRARGPIYKQNDKGVFRHFFGDLELPPFPDHINVRKPMTAENRLTLLDKQGIETAVLFPSNGLLFAGFEEPDLPVALMPAYNDWLADYRADGRGRLQAAGLLTLHDVDAAVKEARRVVADKGAICIMVRPNPVMGRRMDDPAYDPLWATVEELGVPLVVHEGTGAKQTAGGERYGMDNRDAYAYNHAISHPLELMIAMMSLTCGGVMERFPKLQFGFFEAGVSWVPYWLNRLDGHFDKRVLRKQMPHAKLKPSEYFQRQCMLTCDPDDETIPIAVEWLGADKLMFATDYPHFDAESGPVREFMSVKGLSPDDQRKILSDNAAKFFKLKVPAAA